MIRRRFRCLNASLLSLVVAGGLASVGGCPSARPRRPRVPVDTRRSASPATSTEVRLSVSLPEPPPAPLAVLPTAPPFVDPTPLPSRSLKRERKLAFREKGIRRAWVHTHLAARLWRMANRELDHIRRLRSRHPDAGRGDHDQVARLRHRVSAYLKECVALLEGVLEVRGAPRLARLRLAYYLRRLNPAAAVAHFRALVEREHDARRRRRYALDWAHLLLQLGHPGRAAAVLLGPARGARSWRALLLRGVALPWGSVGKERSLSRLMGACDKMPPALQRALVASLPALLTGAAHPGRLLARLAARAPRCWSALAVPKAVTGACKALLVRGRPAAALAVVRAALAASRPSSRPIRSSLRALAARIRRTAGPWPLGDRPPSLQAWRRWLGRRLQGWLRCGRSSVARLRRVVLIAQPAGRVVLSRALVTAPRGASPAPRAMRTCLAREAGAWRSPGWRAAGGEAMRLVVQIVPPARAP